MALLLCCCESSKYPGYSITDGGISYELLGFGDGKVDAKPGDFITVDLVYSTINDSVFFAGRRKFLVEEASFDGDVDECFNMLKIGDKASFIMSVNDFFERSLNIKVPSFFNATDDVVMSVDVLYIQTKESFESEKEEFLSWIEDFEEYERVLLENFIDNQDITIDPSGTGMYYIPIQKGNGKRVEYGDTITVHYEGHFLNGDFFDSTRKRNQAFSFVYGSEWQVIQGLEEAIGKMEEEERAFIVLPSSIAFGNTGSSTGIIPPYTSVIFEVELLKIGGI